MQVQALQGYFDKGVFYQQGDPVALPERKMMIINVLDIPIESEKNLDIDFWKAFDKLAIDSLDEKLSLDDFPQTKFNRNLVVFDEEQAT